MKNVGFVYALCAYFLWGFAPIYWRQIQHVDSFEIIAHRMVWSCLFAVALVILMREWKQLKRLTRERQTVFRLLIGSLLIAFNWGVYIWAVNHGFIIEASMGYFINPLINILFGVIFFAETLRRNQLIAVTLAGLGVAYLIFVHGEIPIIALSLAISFSCYGLVKKKLTIPASQGMAIETALLILPALAYLFHLQGNGTGSFGTDTPTNIYLVLGGLVTLAPLMFFAMAAQRISLTALGMTQYLGPTLQLIIGIWIYHEPFGSDKQIAFACIWAGLVFYSLDQLDFQRKKRALG